MRSQLQELTFYGTQRFMNMFSRRLHWSLSWARWIQSILPHRTFHVPNLVSIFLSLRLLSKESKSEGLCNISQQNYFFFYVEDLLEPRPTPPSWKNHPMPTVRDCLFSIVTYYVCDCRRGFSFDTAFIDHLHVITTKNYNTIADFHTLQITIC
jgi:hypothetical protein